MITPTEKSLIKSFLDASEEAHRKGRYNPDTHTYLLECTDEFLESLIDYELEQDVE